MRALAERSGKRRRAGHRREARHGRAVRRLRAHRHARQRRLGRRARRLRARRHRARAPVSLPRATRAVYAVFILSGFAFASWASRIPQVRDNLELSPRQLGLRAAGDGGRLGHRDAARGRDRRPPRHGADDHRDGAGRGHRPRARPASASRSACCPSSIGLFLFGAGNGTWDVAMNVEGSAVEQRLGKAIMPRFHAGFSVGTVAGALIGSAMVALDVSPTAHLLAVAAVVAVAAPAAVRDFLAVEVHRGARRAAREPAQGLDGAAHAADRPVRVRRRLHRGHRQRLARRSRPSTATTRPPRSAR